MILTPLLLPMVLSSMAFHCEAHTHHASPALAASNGISFTLLIDMDDDHGKNTHLCEADFYFLSDAPSQTGHVDQPYISDDAWNRPIMIRVYGFDAANKHVFGIIREVEASPSTTLFSYNITSSDLLTTDLDGTFRSKLPRACIASLTVVGTTHSSEIVLATHPTPHCPNRRFALALAHDAAQRDIIRSVHMLPASAIILPLDTGKTEP